MTPNYLARLHLEKIRRRFVDVVVVLLSSLSCFGRSECVRSILISAVQKAARCHCEEIFFHSGSLGNMVMWFIEIARCFFF